MSRGISELDVVVLLRDLPESGVRAGDHGTVVLVYDGAFEVEFLAPSGGHVAVLTLDAADVRLSTEDDVRATRPTSPTG